MFKIVRNGQCYAPDYIGSKDIFIAYGKIHKIEDSIRNIRDIDVEIIDASGKIVIPGIIDQHVHIIGGGGEAGFSSRIPELPLSEIILAGVCTLVGTLGFDSVTRSIGNILAKANSLQDEGITAYIYTGSYSVPTKTLTGSVLHDIAFLDKVIGVGEIALSDHRSSHPDISQLKQLASEARNGGMIANKAGIVHIHFGDGKEGLKPLIELVEESEFPIEMFVPTHINRNRNLFKQGLDFLKKGGIIDLTAGQLDDTGISVPEALSTIFRDKSLVDRVTVSSDGNGSIPSFGAAKQPLARMSQLIEDLRYAILNKELDITSVIKTATSNVARVLKLYPRKGTLAQGSDADIVLLDKDSLEIDTVIAGGEIFMMDKVVIKRGMFEREI